MAGKCQEIFGKASLKIRKYYNNNEIIRVNTDIFANMNRRLRQGGDMIIIKCIRFAVKL